MIWRNDGTQHPGPRRDFGTFGRSTTPSCGGRTVSYGSGFVQIGEWRVGNVDDVHMSVIDFTTSMTAVIYRDDGTVHPGPRTDFQNTNAAETDTCTCAQSFKRCAAWGDPHYTATFHDRAFDKMGVGVFRLARNSDKSFELQGFQCPYPDPATTVGGTTFVG